MHVRTARATNESPVGRLVRKIGQHANLIGPVRMLLAAAFMGAVPGLLVTGAEPASQPPEIKPLRQTLTELIPPVAHAKTGSRHLSVSNLVTIVLQPESTDVATYAAECLRGELGRRFNIEAVIVRDPGRLRAGSVSVWVDDVPRHSSPEVPARFHELPMPAKDGYLLGIFPEDREVMVHGFGGNGAIRGVFALAGLLVADAKPAAWPEVLISDTPEIRIRVTRGIFSGKRSSGQLTREQEITCELDWWARWGLNHAMVPSGLTEGGQDQDRLVRWFVKEAHRRGMKAGVNLGGRSLCASDPAQMEQYLSRARRVLDLGCDFFLVLFDDLPRDRLGGHCDRCIRTFGGSLAAEQCHILEALYDTLPGPDPDRPLIWCPTYYSLGMTGYSGAAEGPDKYFTILGRSTRVCHTYMCHCAFDRAFNDYLEAKGLTHRIWWYNGIRTDYYMVSRAFDGYDMWGPPLRIPGLKDFQSFFSPFGNGWLMPSFASADRSLHPCVAPLVTAHRDELGRTIIPQSSWEELTRLPERMQGLYLCSATTPYHIALAGVFAAHPSLFNQQRAQGVIADAMFSRGASPHVLAWQTAYARAQMVLARTEGHPLTPEANAEVVALTGEMETSEKALRDCLARDKQALPASLAAALLDEMSAWRLKVRSLAASHPPAQPP